MFNKLGFDQDAYFGVVLAAGFGSRLRPLTNTIPKPLIPFLGVPLLYINLNRLASIGIIKFGINTHYLAKQIVSAIEKFPLNVDLNCSFEPTLLGTAGAYIPMERMRNRRAVIAVNGDIVTDFKTESLVARHEELDAVASMGLLASPHKNEATIWVRNNRVVSIGERPPDGMASPHGFACVQVLSDQFLRGIEPDGPTSIIDYYKSALEAGEIIAADVQRCFWFDLGTWGDYWQAHRSYLTMLSANPDLMSQDSLGVFEFAKTFFDMSFDLVATDYTDQFSNKFFGPSLVDKSISLAGENTIGPYAVAVGQVKLAHLGRVRDSIVCNHDKLPMSGDFDSCLYYGGFQLPFKQ